MAKPASDTALPVHMVHLLAKRPELRQFFPLADQVDQAVRA